jgi:hypothetical protein
VPTKPEIVAAFLATLELSRLKKMRVHQEMTYAPIWLELLESLKNFDENMADGFDNPNPPPKAEGEANPEQADALLTSAEPGNPQARPEDDRRAAMDLSGEVEFNPLAELDAQMGGHSDLVRRS